MNATRSRTSAALALAALAAMAFCYLTSEMLPVGLLPRIAASLDASLPATGVLLSVYALVVTLAGPPMTALVGRAPRKRLLLVLAGTLALSTALCALAQTYAFLMAARLLNALAHGIFWSIVASCATSVVSPARRGSALAIVYAGSSAGIVLGVPLATFVGERLGWHAAFAAVAAVAVLAFVVVAALPDLPSAQPSSLGDIRALLRDAAFVRLLLSTTLVVIGNFTAFTYFAPLLARPAALVTGGIPTLLLAYGIAGFGSSFAFGWIANRRAIVAIVAAAGTIFVAFMLLAVLDRTGSIGPAAATAIVALWGLGMGGAAVSLQARVLAAQPNKPDVASALNSSAFNLGIGGGAFVGGLVVRLSGLDAVFVVAAFLVAPAIALLLVPPYDGAVDIQASSRMSQT